MSGLYLVNCHDQENSGPARAASLSKHLKQISSEIDNTSLAAALKDDEDKFSGSVMIVEAENREYARKFVERDPFNAADVWKHMEVFKLGASARTWVGTPQSSPHS